MMKRYRIIPLLVIGMGLFTLLFSAVWLIFMLVLSTLRQPQEPAQAPESRLKQAISLLRNSGEACPGLEPGAGIQG